MPMGGFVAAGGAGPAAAAPAAEEEEAAPAAAEKTLFNLKLEKFDAGSKPKVIKEIKSMLGLSLVDSKKFVESAPKMMKEGVPKEDFIEGKYDTTTASHLPHRPPEPTAQHVRPGISRPQALRLRRPPRNGSPPGRRRSTAEDAAEMAV